MCGIRSHNLLARVISHQWIFITIYMYTAWYHLSLLLRCKTNRWWIPNLPLVFYDYCYDLSLYTSIQLKGGHQVFTLMWYYLCSVPSFIWSSFIVRQFIGLLIPDQTIYLLCHDCQVKCWLISHNTWYQWYQLCDSLIFGFNFL